MINGKDQIDMCGSNEVMFNGKDQIDMCGSNDDHSDGVLGDQLFSPPPPPPLPEIPSELITDILPRLPVSSLLQFRCVCKQWNSIISDTDFAKLHLSRSTMDPALNHHRLLLNQSTCQHQFSFSSCSVKSLFNNPFTPLEDLNLSLRPDNYFILGTCNGVVCFCDVEKKHLLLCNPSTRLMSRCYPLQYYTLDETLLFYGFGYDHVNDQFKAVLVFRDYHGNDFRTVTEVCAFGDNRWTTIQNLNYLGLVGYPTDGSGIFVGGNLNWVAQVKIAGTGDPSHVIRSFNLGTETFGELSLPDFGHDS